jgi:hypothetical protein
MNNKANRGTLTESFREQNGSFQEQRESFQEQRESFQGQSEAFQRTPPRAKNKREGEWKKTNRGETIARGRGTGTGGKS